MIVYSFCSLVCIIVVVVVVVVGVFNIMLLNIPRRSVCCDDFHISVHVACLQTLREDSVMFPAYIHQVNGELKSQVDTMSRM